MSIQYILHHSHQKFLKQVLIAICNNTNLGAKEFGVLNKMQLHHQDEGLVHETRAPPISSHDSMKKYVIITDFKSVRVDYNRAHVSLAFNM